MKKITFHECPRPQFVRDSFTLLNGQWDFAFDHENQGDAKGYPNGFTKEHDIVVPFAYECEASLINIQTRCDHVWYQKTLQISPLKSKRYILHIEGADFITTVYLNGNRIGQAKGAYHRLSFDLTTAIQPGENLLVIKCDDDYSLEKPRGKQRWKDESFTCFYVDTTGIYKTVWLEEVPASFVKGVKITPLLDEEKVILDYVVENGDGLELTSIVTFEGEEVATNTSIVEDGKLQVELSLTNHVHLWEVGKAALYDLSIRMGEDKVSSYFGLRKIEAKDGQIFLNNKPLYQKLVLDQGYFLKSHLTPPSNKALYEDITKMMEVGFNGCRKHQKVEDERFLYYADILGYLVWAEMPSMFECTSISRAEFEYEWVEAVKQQYNHPCIIVWTPLNESWGVPNILTDKVQQDFANLIYHLTKQIDPYRLVISNDGWEHTTTDIVTMHHYEQDPEKLYAYFQTKEKCLGKTFENHSRGAFAEGYSYQGQPIMMTEFGGTAYQNRTEGTSNWGYGTGVNDDQEYVHRFIGLIRSLNKMPHLCGYCYTQVSDVQQEINGILYENRDFKVDPNLLKVALDERN